MVYVFKVIKLLFYFNLFDFTRNLPRSIWHNGYFAHSHLSHHTTTTTVFFCTYHRPQDKKVNTKDIKPFMDHLCISLNCDIDIQIFTCSLLFFHSTCLIEGTYFLSFCLYFIFQSKHYYLRLRCTKLSENHSYGEHEKQYFAMIFTFGNRIHHDNAYFPHKYTTK